MASSEICSDPVSLVTAKQLPLVASTLPGEALDAVHQLEMRAHSHPWSRSLLESGLSRYHCWGIQTNDQWIGFAIVSVVVGEAELLDFVVSPDYQGQGVGSCFMDWLLEQVATLADRFYLEVRASNAPAIALYQNVGFAEVGLRPNYYPAAKGREDAVLMAMELFAAT